MRHGMLQRRAQARQRGPRGAGSDGRTVARERPRQSTRPSSAFV
ncbi:hypothetical protein BURMUCGD2M_5529 [Burkholderia multivorans CGD2M]|uniref:Uncharacterized protein n=1 Tax=Burkholderia multivorans CGD2 TaxID=513052 RepID=B9BKD0_9BURK|nr:hypothetical protein BURMUCGD1_5100 [Burkholderia multivorans CGD1]EEE08397.1 hypothetical protein BURMUCGD2_5539 [Burkholderia multivorans CGD2]EEE16083.1 hypothetical protein BURMUCGD2M_5529 [Burkholderia multivorans CGD2M]